MVRLTRAQREAVWRVFQRDWPNYITPRSRHVGTRCKHCGQWSSPEIVKCASGNYRRFRALVKPAFGDSCVMLPWSGMWLGIEADGYTHS